MTNKIEFEPEGFFFFCYYLVITAQHLPVADPKDIIECVIKQIENIQEEQ